MKSRFVLIVLTLFLFVAKFEALELFLDNENTNERVGLVYRNVSQSIIAETADLASSVALIEYQYYFIDDDDISDKGLSRAALSALGRRRRRRRSLTNQPLFRCLGNLITTKFVLTAASCVKYTGDYKPTSIRLADRQNIAIANIIPHEDYYANIPENFEDANKNNIALIKLKTEAVLGKQVAVISYIASSNANQVTIDWRLLDGGTLPSNLTSLPNFEDNEKYNFEIMPVHVYGNGPNLPATKYLEKIIADGGIGTIVSEFVDWIDMKL